MGLTTLLQILNFLGHENSHKYTQMGMAMFNTVFLIKPGGQPFEL